MARVMTTALHSHNSCCWQLLDIGCTDSGLRVDGVGFMEAVVVHVVWHGLVVWEVV